MKLAVMQPYFFPYAGYFKLIAEVDKFVFLDDVNYIKSGWINRNRLFLAGDVRYITVPLVGASTNLKINQISIQSRELWLYKLLDSVRQSYSKAPNFTSAFDLLRAVLLSGGENNKVSDIARRSILEVSERLNFNVSFIKTSAIYENATLKGSDRVIDICLREKASKYYNLSGGRDLYKEDDFAKYNLQLEFVESNLSSYHQSSREFIPGLSILDVLMFNSFDDARRIIIDG